MKKEQKLFKYLTKDAEEVEDRVLRFIGSDEGRDRDDDVILLDGWDLKDYKSNPVILVNHNPYELPVAQTVKVWKDNVNKRLMFDVKFPTPEESSLGDTLYKLYKGGWMRATSVGFSPDWDQVEWGDGQKTPRRTFKKQQLLELSLVSVPANPRALMTSKSIQDALDKNIVDKVELDELDKFLETLENQFLTKENLEQINNEHSHVCLNCGDELICVKCKGFTGDSESGDYLEYFFKDLGEPKANTADNSGDNEYIDELLSMLKSVE